MKDGNLERIPALQDTCFLPKSRHCSDQAQAPLLSLSISCFFSDTARNIPGKQILRFTSNIFGKFNSFHCYFLGNPWFKTVLASHFSVHSFTIPPIESSSFQKKHKTVAIHQVSFFQKGRRLKKQPPPECSQYDFPNCRTSLFASADNGGYGSESHLAN